MDYKKLILIEHIIRTIVNKNSENQYELVFKMNGQLYTGTFLNYENQGRYFVPYFEVSWGYENNKDPFLVSRESQLQHIRSAYFAFAFKGAKNFGRDTLSDYASLPEFVLRDMVEFVNVFESEVFNPDVEFPNCIYSLKNIETEKMLDFYFLTDEVITPVSLQVKK